LATMRKFKSLKKDTVAAFFIIAIALLLSCSQNEVHKEKDKLVISESEATDYPWNVIDINVINKQDKKPMDGVELDIRIDSRKKRKVTDQNGKCRIIFRKGQIDYISIKVSKDGYVPVRKVWRLAEKNIEIPDEYTFSIEPGTSIGGIIKDKQGKPIEGAKVFLLVPGGNETERVAIRGQEEITDANGRWCCDIVPLELDDVWIRLTHPDYIDDEIYGLTPRPTIEKLRDMTGVMVMKKGLEVTGRVLDMNELPIKGASVAQGSDRFGSNYPSTKTDDEGRFKFTSVRPGDMVLTVQAKGYSPDLRQITVHEGIEPVEFLLKTGQTIRGRIVDTSGNPVSKAFVAADTWRGHRSLDWRIETDAEGWFQWDDAPADEVIIDMGKQRYMSIRNYSMSASKKEYVITMHPPLRISGKVTDAETGEPIGRFDVLPGVDWGNNQPIYWERRNAAVFTEGNYEITFDEPQHEHLIRIEADGYIPGISRGFKIDEGDVVFDFKLEKGTGPVGTVFFKNGTPAAGAEVILCTLSQGAYIRDGRNEQKRDSQYVETKQDGRFSFPPQIGPFSVVVLHDRGYAEVTREELEMSSELMLQPWARVEGKLLIGKEPGINQVVRVSLEEPYEPNSPRIYHDCQANTDSNGYFVFERVPSGKAQVSREIKLSDRMTTFSHAVPVEIKSGETITVTIGGTGRPVVGKVAAPADYKQPINWNYGHNSLSLKLSEPPGHENLEQMSMEERRSWYETWSNSDEGKAFIEEQRKQRQFYTFKIEHDGTFRIEDVPAGKYQLSIMVHEPPVATKCGYGELIGMVSHEFDIPEMPGGRSDEPLHIGPLELEIKKRIRVGDVAPLFELKTLDGEELKLENFRGKIVLLDFWAVWCGPCVAEVPNLKEIYDAFGKDERFVMIGLSLDGKAEMAKEYVDKNGMKWLQGFVGGGFNSKVVKDYGVQGIPAKFLIGADGNVIGKYMNIGQFKSAISKALMEVSDER